MNLPTIQMAKEDAKAAFLEYREAVRKRHNHEDEAIMRGYRALSRGQQVIEIFETIRAGGVVEVDDRQGNTKRLPALAVMRANRLECWMTRDSDGDVTFQPEQWYRGRKDRIRVTGAVTGTIHGWTGGWRAMLPIVPPALRPKANMANYHILWEAEWVQQGRAAAPGDPALLRHLGGALYAVVAVWELTPLEKAVLAGTRG